MVRSPKKAEENEPREVSRARLELAAFGSTRAVTNGQLTKSEVWWSLHFEWLKSRGYLLRPRYAPGWVPSWIGTKRNMFLCEDGRSSKLATTLLDATRISDGAYVVLKIIKVSDHPHEVEIGRMFSAAPLSTDPANHCVSIYDVIPVDEDQDKVIIVMPLLARYISPPLCTIGEAVECFRQLFEGLQFMHRNRVAHRDCMTMNIMMDPSKLYVDPFHPVHPLMKRDFSGYARFKTRTQCPVKYYFIDFGLSRWYDPSISNPLEVPIWGGDKEVPEFQNNNEPRDPFPTDVFYIGNAIRKDFVEPNHGLQFMGPIIADMVQEDPSKRPTIDEVVTRFEIIRKSLGPWKLRSRLADKQENMLENAILTVSHWTRQLRYVAKHLPAVPLPPS
ncbi:hypothetical protein J3A83DRAFT_4230974 [Scleroderma citrinum]